MATIQQCQRGLANFVDREVSVAYSGVEKALLLGGTTFLAAKLPDVLKMYTSKPLIGAMGIYDAERGVVDIDSLYNAFVPHIGAEKIPITLPKLGTIKLGKEEIDLLMKYIKEA